MKERIVIERNEDTSEYYKKFPNRSGKQIEHIEVLAPIEQNVRFEQVPETFEELKELCKDLEDKDVFITSAGDCIEYHGLQFWVSGTVCHETEKFYSIKSDRTPQQMWQIIKSLIGEE